MGELAADIAAELIPFVRDVEVLNKAQRDMILASLAIHDKGPQKFLHFMRPLSRQHAGGE